MQASVHSLFRGPTDIGLWSKSVRICNSIRATGKQSIRHLARHTGLSKSSGHRHLQAIGRRDHYPESWLWETPEGRNGYVSQRQHNPRGLPKRRYQVWTVLHNFDYRASDGTTPASRFFRRGFPDLFESVLSHIDDLPGPRQRHQALVVSD